MKKTIFGLLLMCCTLAAHAQLKPLQDDRYATKDVLAQLEGMVDKFCKYVEFIGSTPIDEKDRTVLSEKKKRMREDEVPKLFHHYEERKMITTSSYTGKAKPPKPMRTYFRNLQTQADYGRMDSRITYDLEFTFASDKGKLEWKKGKRHPDGTQEYEAKVFIYQTYLNETVRGLEVVRQRREVDRKEMIVKRIVLPNGNTVYGLDDIKSAEQLRNG